MSEERKMDERLLHDMLGALMLRYKSKVGLTFKCLEDKRFTKIEINTYDYINFCDIGAEDGNFDEAYQISYMIFDRIVNVLSIFQCSDIHFMKTSTWTWDIVYRM